MNFKLIFILLLCLVVFPFVSATDIMGNFTSLGSDSDFVDYVFAFDNSLDNYAVFIIIISMIIVVTFSVYGWSNEIMTSMIFGLFLGTFISLLCAVIVNDAGDRLLSWEKFSFIASLLVLASIYNKVSSD